MVLGFVLLLLKVMVKDLFTGAVAPSGAPAPAPLRVLKDPCVRCYLREVCDDDDCGRRYGVRLS